MSERPAGAPSSARPYADASGEPVALPLLAVDRRAHRRLGAEREEVADERERGRPGDEHPHAAVALGGRQVADARDERLRLRPVGDRGEHDRVGRARRRRTPARRPATAARRARRRTRAARSRPRAGRAARATGGSALREPREPPVLRPLAVGREVHVDERARRHERAPRRRAARPSPPPRRTRARRRARAPRRRRARRATRPRAPEGRSTRRAHAARRRCLRSAKSMITGMPSSA